MNQLKIGKFIAERRKERGLTQLQLAEKLNVTDKAISKWETGRGIPDAVIMLPLCKELGITVTDLLSGEVVSAENYNAETEGKLLDMMLQKERNDRLLFKLEWVIGILSLVVLFLPIMIAAFLPMEEWIRLLLAFSGFIPCFAGFCFALKIEQVAGYYECQHCKHRYVPTYKAVNRAMHLGRSRWMKCPSCEKKSWQKKVLNKEE